MPPKRKSVADGGVAPKRARVNPSLTMKELNEMTKEELVEYAFGLQEQLASAGPAVKALSPEEITDKARKGRQLIVSGVQKQMKWTPSCKTGKARFAYDGQVQDVRVFKRMLRLPDTHEKKTFKMSTKEFTNIVGEPEGSTRYATLAITSKDINVRWSPEELTFKVSGTYGKQVFDLGSE